VTRCSLIEHQTSQIHIFGARCMQNLMYTTPHHPFQDVNHNTMHCEAGCYIRPPAWCACHNDTHKHLFMSDSVPETQDKVLMSSVDALQPSPHALQPTDDQTTSNARGTVASLSAQASLSIHQHNKTVSQPENTLEAQPTQVSQQCLGGVLHRHAVHTRGRGHTLHHTCTTYS
jgi:hypothetical protein